MRAAAGVVASLLAVAAGAQGVIYILAIWTSDTSIIALATYGGLLLAGAAALLVASALLLRDRFRRSSEP